MSNPTQVVQVVANTISGIELSDVTWFSFEEEVPKPASKLHKVDNGVVLKYGSSGISDISFEKIPTDMMPASTQNSYQWYCDLMTTGIANSVNDEKGAAYLKTFKATPATPLGCKQIDYMQAYRRLRPNTKPWILFSDLPAEHFQYFDSVKLYEDMAKRNFAYGAYDVTYIDEKVGIPKTELGQFLAIPMEPSDVSPAFFQADSTFKINVAFHPNQTIRLFWPAYWINNDTDSGLAMAAMEPTTAGVSGLTTMRDASAYTRSLY